MLMKVSRLNKNFVCVLKLKDSYYYIIPTYRQYASI